MKLSSSPHDGKFKSRCWKRADLSAWLLSSVLGGFRHHRVHLRRRLGPSDPQHPRTSGKLCTREEVLDHHPLVNSRPPLDPIISERDDEGVALYLGFPVCRAFRLARGNRPVCPHIARLDDPEAKVTVHFPTSCGGVHLFGFLESLRSPLG